MDTKFDLTAFRQEFLISGEGWGVSDCYKTYDDKFLRRDAQDAYEGAKWAWQHQQAKVEELQKRVDAFKDHAVMLRSAAKSYAYTEREQNILLSQADDIEKILGLEQRPNGEEQ